MKANVIFKAMCVVVMLVASVSMVNAQTYSYYTNDVIENGKVTTRFVHKHEGGLKYFQKSELSYDEMDRLVSKEIFEWNKHKEIWVPQNRILYSYNNSEIVIERDSWNKKEQTYTDRHLQAVYDINERPQLVAQLTNN